MRQRGGVGIVEDAPEVGPAQVGDAVRRPARHMRACAPLRERVARAFDVERHVNGVAGLCVAELQLEHMTQGERVAGAVQADPRGRRRTKGVPGVCLAPLGLHRRPR